MILLTLVQSSTFYYYVFITNIEQYKVEDCIKTNCYAVQNFQGDGSPKRDEGSWAMCGDDALLSGVGIMSFCK